MILVALTDSGFVLFCLPYVLQLSCNFILVTNWLSALSCLSCLSFKNMWSNLVQRNFKKLKRFRFHRIPKLLIYSGIISGDSVEYSCKVSIQTTLHLPKPFRRLFYVLTFPGRLSLFGGCVDHRGEALRHPSEDENMTPKGFAKIAFLSYPMTYHFQYCV